MRITFMLLLNFVELSVNLFKISNLEFLYTGSVILAPCCWGITVTDSGGLVAVSSLLSRCSRCGLLSL